MDIDEIIKRIKYFRKKINFSAKKLSLKIGKKENYISQIECKNFTVSIPVLFRIIEALEISCDEFFSDDYMNYEQNKKIFGILNTFSPEIKKILLDLMKNTKY